MIRLGAPSADLTYHPVSDETSWCPGRLLVLVPADTDYSAATRRIWKLAQDNGSQVQLLGLCKDTAEEPALRRGLLNMTSLLNHEGVCADAKVEIGTNWMHLIKNHYTAGDMIVCFEEQHPGLLHRPLSQVLKSNFKATVYILSDLTPQKPKPNLLSQAGAWLGFIGIIIGFGIVQANIVQLPDGTFQNSLLILSLLPEFWLIWMWGSQVG
jgi:hypothetical protein